MLKRNKKIAQICALAMCANLIQGSFVNGYASEIRTSETVSGVEVSEGLTDASESESEVDNEDIESETAEDISSDEESNLVVLSL